MLVKMSTTPDYKPHKDTHSYTDMTKFLTHSSLKVIKAQKMGVMMLHVLSIWKWLPYSSPPLPPTYGFVRLVFIFFFCFIFCHGFMKAVRCKNEVQESKPFLSLYKTLHAYVITCCIGLQIWGF